MVTSSAAGSWAAAAAAAAASMAGAQGVGAEKHGRGANALRQTLRYHDSFATQTVLRFLEPNSHEVAVGLKAGCRKSLVQRN